MSATQPITLITATPGGGKTALAVQMMKAAVDQGVRSSSWASRS